MRRGPIWIGYFNKVALDQFSRLAHFNKTRLTIFQDISPPFCRRCG